MKFIHSLILASLLLANLAASANGLQSLPKINVDCHDCIDVEAYEVVENEKEVSTPSLLGSRRLKRSVTAMLLTLPILCSGVQPALASFKFKGPDAKKRHLEVVNRARVIVNPDVSEIPSKNVVTGPDSVFQPKDFGDAFGKKTLNCHFLDKDTEAAEGASGKTKKFWCKDDGEYGGKVWKVKYSLQDSKAPNQESFSEIAGTRLLWLMGFGADVVNPVRVNCVNCPEDPWDDHYRNTKAKAARTDGKVTSFSFASVEEKFPGKSLKYKLPGESTKKGWDFDDLMQSDLDEPTLSKKELAEKEALAFVSPFLWNLDTKGGNNRLVCAPGSTDAENCLNPTAIWQDTGWSFGGVHARDPRTRKLSFDHWAKVKGMSKSCKIGQRIFIWGLEFELSDAALKVVQDRLGSITQEQWEDLFMVAQFNLHRYGRPSKDDPVYGNMKTHEAWADVAMKKVDEIMDIESCK